MCFISKRRNDPYVLNSTVSFMVISMPYRIQPPTLPQHRTSVRKREQYRITAYVRLQEDYKKFITTAFLFFLQMGTLVLWGTPDVSFAVPLWVIILAILLGLLVLAILTLAMWKVHTYMHILFSTMSSAFFSQ